MAANIDLDDLHRQIITILRDGRSTPSHLADRTGESRQLVSKRLRDLKMAGIVTLVHRGLYELNPDAVPDHATEDDER